MVRGHRCRSVRLGPVFLLFASGTRSYSPVHIIERRVPGVIKSQLALRARNVTSLHRIRLFDGKLFGLLKSATGEIWSSTKNDLVSSLTLSCLHKSGCRVSEKHLQLKRQTAYTDGPNVSFAQSFHFNQPGGRQKRSSFRIKLRAE